MSFMQTDTQQPSPYQTGRPVTAAHAEASERGAFIARTYFHLIGAIAAFVALEATLFAVDSEGRIAQAMLGVNWLFVLGAFMLVSWVADKWARSATSPGMQYLGLGLFVIAEALIFFPLLFIAAHYGGPEVIPTAGVSTVLLFTALSAFVFLTRKDFSFLRGVLFIGGIVALGIIVCGALFGFDLGVIFTVAMIGFAAGFVLYDTSNVLHHYRTDQHVSAALALFAAIALMFWYILQLFMSRD